MEEADVETVILVCDDEEDTRHILSRLTAQGIGVVGPATSPAQARTLAAQTFANIAVLAPRPTAGPLGPELARDLLNTWGVRSLILSDRAEREFSPLPAQAERLRRILGQPEAR